MILLKLLLSVFCKCFWFEFSLKLRLLIFNLLLEFSFIFSENRLFNDEELMFELIMLVSELLIFWSNELFVSVLFFLSFDLL